MKAILALCGALVATSAAAQAPDHSYGGSRPHCARMDTTEMTDLFLQGKCFGMIIGVIGSTFEICEPEKWSAGQAHYIIKRYAEARPTEWQTTSYPMMARQALIAAWPCREPPATARGRMT